MKTMFKKVLPSGLTLLAACILLFLYAPIFALIYVSMHGGVMSGSMEFSYVAYCELFKSREIFRMLFNSFLIATCSSLFSLIIGTVFVCVTPVCQMNRLLPIFYLNNAVPEVMIAGALTLLFASVNLPFGFGALIVGHTLLGLGYVVPLVWARLQQLDPSLIEASLDLGATVQQTFVRVVIPAVMPALISSAALVFLISFDDLVISFFCAGSFWQTLPLYIFARLRTGVSPAVTALSALWVLTGISGVIISQWIIRHYERREQE